MKGVYTDPDPGAGPRQPPEVLGAWIHELLGDVHEAQGKRLLQLRARLQLQAFEWDASPLAQAITALASAARELHFQDLRQGWLARQFGKHKPIHAQFAAAYDRMAGCAATVKKQQARLAASYKEHTANARRVLVELDMEWQALNTEIDQGVGWLQDMCAQLAEARAQGRTEPPLETLAEAAQFFTQEFKRLQGAGAIAHDITVRANAVTERRSALLEQVRGDMDGFDKQWMLRLGRVVADLKGGRSASPAIPPAIEAHDELLKHLSASTDACGALQNEEHLLAEQLGMLHQQLEPRRHQPPRD